MVKNVWFILMVVCVSSSAWAEGNYDEGEKAYKSWNFVKSWRLLKPLADSGDKKSQTYVGMMYNYGKGVKEDYKQAAGWYRKAAEQGYAQAQHNLGLLYELDLGNDYKQAVGWYRKAAEQGYAQAQDRLAYMYEQGRGVEKSYKNAEAWYRKAMAQGYKRSQAHLGEMFFDEGRYFYDKQDYKQALSWFHKAAKQDDKHAQNYLGWMYQDSLGLKQDYQQAAIWYRKAAEQGNKHAQNNLGEMYYYGRGVEKDYDQATGWYHKAAKQGHTLAKKNEKKLLEKKKKIIAFKRFLPKAKAGDMEAQNNIGKMYYYNDAGIEQDKKKSLFWFRKAADQGHMFAQNQLGLMYELGQGEEQSDKKSLFWYQKAAEQGYTPALNQLGWMYQHGNGVKQNYQQAAIWYRKVEEKGDDFAKKNLRLVLKKLEEDPCNALTTELFGALIGCSNRDAMMAAIKKSGASVKQEDKGKWGDVYYTSNVLKGSSELYVGYTVDDGFAYAKYTFPSHMDSQQVVKIKDMVASKYGRPSYSSGNVVLGEVTYKWQFKDGIELKVSRGWPNTTTYLRYTFLKNYKAMQDEIERQRRAREKKEAQAQTNAF